jgi:hypothetical protein
MFEAPVVDSLDARSCADRLDASVLRERSVGAERLALAAHWADLHPVVAEAPPDWTPHRRRTQTRARACGADGTPAVSEFAVEELGCLLRTTTTSAAGLMRDALELRHRHPQLWEAVMTGRVEDWKARKVARATTAADLGINQARWVDGETVTAVTNLPFGRAMSVIEAKIIAADPEGYEERRQQEAERRYVSVGRGANRFGMRTLIAQTTAGDVLRLNAMVDHLAELLGAAGDGDPKSVRRAKALGLLANPAMACVFLADQHPDVAPMDDAEPAEVEPGGPESVPPSAVELAVWFGRLLRGLGKKALNRLRPRTVLYLHIAEEAVRGHAGSQVGRAEELGAVGVGELREWLGTDRVVVRPVLDPMGLAPVDEHAIPARHREAMQLMCPVEIYPWGTRASRRADGDHTKPYVPVDRGGPPGQTRLDNLGPLGRRHHRAKTVGGFTLHQPLPGMFLWRIPSGHWYQVDNEGTHALGRETPAIIEQLQAPGSVMENAFRRMLAVA